MTPLLIGALSAGIVGSPHCIGMCGGFAAACSERVSDAAAYHVGRLLTYGTLGAAAGWIGGAIPGPGWFPAVVAGILLVGFSARLAGLLPEMHIKMPWLTRAGGALLGQKSLLGRGAFGALTGLLPCGLTWAALSMPVASGTAWSGALLMAAFWMAACRRLGRGAAIHRDPTLGSKTVGRWRACIGSIQYWNASRHGGRNRCRRDAFLPRGIASSRRPCASSDFRVK